MKKYISIVVADIKNIKRDPTLLLMLWVPFMILFFVRFGVPYISNWWPEMANYHTLVILFFSLLIAIFPGFIVSFMILDEKDAQLLPAIKVTPVSVSGFLVIRISYIVLLSSLFSFLFLRFNGIVHFSLVKSITLAVLSALNTPVLILLISAFAKNKVEGMTYLKVANITFILPIAGLFIPTAGKYLFAIFPAFWIIIFENEYSFPSDVLFAVIGFIILIGENYLSFLFCRNKLHSL